MRNWDNEGLGYLNFPIAAILLSIFMHSEYSVMNLRFLVVNK